MRRVKKHQLGYGRWIILILCGMIFCFCAAYIGLYARDNIEAEKSFDEIKGSGQDRLLSLHQKNSDIIGWIKIDGTKVDYPVMYTPDNTEKYLHRNFQKEDSEAGTPFLSSLDSENWMIHGHNMKAGTMFHDLLKYEEKEFREEHSEFTLEMIGDNHAIEKGRYEIVAACRSYIRKSGEEGFRYYSYQRITDEAAFSEYVNGIGEEALYETGITPEYGQQLVTLSTCAYHTDRGRFYIVGVKVE